MANLKTKYMGLELKNPIIVGACNLVTNTDTLKKIEEKGAAAVVYKTLFEEQVSLENLEMYELRTEYEERNAEMTTLFPNSKTGPQDPQEHLLHLRKASEAVSIPVLASLNAISDETWVGYAKMIEQTGVDGIELNFYTLPGKSDEGNADIEKNQLKVFREVKAAVKIPVSVKLSPFYTNPLKIISDFDRAKADGLVLFNRLFQPDINTQTERHVFPYNLSSSDDHRLPLRFAGLLYGNTDASVCANSGILNGHDVIKMLLAGADSVQVVSALYKNGTDVIAAMIKDMENWMDSKGYDTIDSFRGKLSRKNTTSELPYQRAQYLDFMMGTSEIMKKYKAIR
jgi:dihydroorotate dehydrogenase (fumarate)